MTVNRQAQRSKGKGKKGKRGKAKRKPKQPIEASLDEVPLESYRIIEDESGTITDYLMAVYSCVREWIELRQYLQSIWREVAYGGLNSAVAGELSNLAIALVKQTEFSISVEFPGHDSYHTIMQTVTRGDVEKASTNFGMSMHRIAPDGTTELVGEAKLDAREQFMVYTYDALVDFVTDFQQTRSGKPTKRLLKELNGWSPTFNLQTATKEERLNWRRSYMINWLFDLVNVFSSIVVQRINIKGQKILLENVDWSTRGPWNEHRRLYGLNTVRLPM